MRTSMTLLRVIHTMGIEVRCPFATSPVTLELSTQSCELRTFGSRPAVTLLPASSARSHPMWSLYRPRAGEYSVTITRKPLTMMARIALLLFLFPLSSLAERVFDELIFTAEKCEELGYAQDFEACAVLEFCTKKQHRKLDPGDYLEENWEDDENEEVDPHFASEVEEAEMEQGHKNPAQGIDQVEAEEVLKVEEPDQPKQKKHAKHKAPNRAKYGYKLQGSSTCSWPAPIMRLKRGVNHGLFVKGSTEATNVHFHGLHIAGHGNGDDLYRSIKGENTLIYDINLPADQQLGGTHWYHSHMLGAAGKQVKGGAFGMIVVDDNGHDVGTNDENVLGFLANEKVFVMDNSKGGWKVNGLGQEVYHFVKDEWYRMRILAVNLSSHSDQVTVHFGEGCKVHIIAHDGIFRFEVPSEQRDAFVLTSSSRLDVAIQCSKSAEIVVLHGETLATISVDSSKQPSHVTPFVSGTENWKSSRLEYTKDLAGMEPDHWWTIHVDETNINGIGSSQNEPFCDDDGNDFQYGTLAAFELHGADTHPFHVHMYPMQVVSKGCGSGHEMGEFYDTIVTNDADKSSPCLLRLQLVDIAGPTTVHCHIFLHAEQGALGWFNVIGGPIQSGPTCLSGSQCGEVVEELPKCSDPQWLRRTR